MGFKLDTGKTYKDKHGNEHGDFKIFVDTVVIDKKNEIVTVFPTMYANQTARENKEQPVKHGFKKEYSTTKAKYDAFFAIAILKDKDIFEQAYLFLADVENPDQTKVLADWVSDE